MRPGNRPIFLYVLAAVATAALLFIAYQVWQIREEHRPREYMSLPGMPGYP